MFRRAIGPFLLVLAGCLPTTCLAEGKAAPRQTSEVADLKYESVILRDGGPAVTIHILCRAARLDRRPAILMLGSLHPTSLLIGVRACWKMATCWQPSAWPIHPIPIPLGGLSGSYLTDAMPTATCWAVIGRPPNARRVIEYLAKRGDVNLEKIGWIGSSSTGIQGFPLPPKAHDWGCRSIRQHRGLCPMA